MERSLIQWRVDAMSTGAFRLLFGFDYMFGLDLY